MSLGSEQAPAPAVRLTFAYDPSGIRLIDRTEVHKSAGASIDPGVSPPAGSIVAELRTNDDRPTFRRILPPDAVPSDVEVFDPGVPGGVRRHPTPPSSGVFTVVVPADAAADQVVLVGGAQAAPQVSAEEGDSERGPVVLARFSLQEGGGFGR